MGYYLCMQPVQAENMAMKHLYKDLAEKMERQEFKAIFQTLMEEEKQHKEHYTQFLSTVDEKRTPSAQGYDEYDEYESPRLAFHP